jgi:hypothetical protein
MSDVRTIGLAAPAAPPPADPRHDILDVAASADGFLTILTVNGEIWEQRPWTGFNRGDPIPEAVWEQVPPPPGELTRLLVAGGRLHVICDGQLLRRVIDEDHPDRLFRPHWIWRAVEMPTEKDRR